MPNPHEQVHHSDGEKSHQEHLPAKNGPQRCQDVRDDRRYQRERWVGPIEAYGPVGTAAVRVLRGFS